MSLRNRWSSRCCGVLAVMLLGTGCTTAIQGAAKISSCAKYALNKCVEYTPVQPKTGKVIQVWLDNRKRAANMLCTAPSDAQLESYLGPSYFRYVTPNGHCRIVARTDRGSPRGQRLVLSISVFPQAVAKYATIDGYTKTSISGQSALILTTKSRGDRFAKYIIGTASTAEQGGVIFVNVGVRRARGDHQERTLDYTLLQHKKEIATVVIDGLL